MTKEFTTKKRESRPVPFSIDGEDFVFTPPKRAGLIMSVVTNVGLEKAGTDSDSTRDLLNWVSEGLPEEQAQVLLDRLKDPDDDFDLEQINDIARYLLSQSSNRPTKRRSGS